METGKNAKFETINSRNGERGVALAIAVIIVAILAVVALTALTFSSTEVRIASSDLQRTHAFYASASGI
jgi:Tfp pilus assembly protein PilX